MKGVKKVVFCAASIVFLLSPCLSAQVSLKEIRVSTQGTLIGVVFSVYSFEILLDDSGMVRRIEASTALDDIRNYKFYGDMLKSGGSQSRTCNFEKGKLTSIDNIQIKYDRKYSSRVEYIDEVYIEYWDHSKSAGKIRRIGDIEFGFLPESNRIEFIDNTMFEYHKNESLIGGFDQRVSIRSNDEDLIIRLVQDLR